MDKDKLEVKKPMTEAERLELAQKLDQELDDFINGLEKRQYTEGWPEDRWEEEMDKHPFFMKKAPEPGEELHPLLEGIQQLKYDPAENTAEDLAHSYKEDGNFNFKHKKYRLAILSYTEGIRQKHDNNELKATLYNNRSAANFFLGNYRSALRDCEIALRLKPDYAKAISRAAQCCFQISHYDKCVDYCDQILAKTPQNAEILSLRQKSVNTKKSKERDERKKLIAEKRKLAQEEKLIKEILSRGYNLDVGKNGLQLENLEPHFPELMNSRVYLSEDNQLIWPVVLLYPEYKTMDFIQRCSEEDIIGDHLQAVFEQPPDWDLEHKYKLQNLNIYFENFKKTKVHKVDIKNKLRDILKQKEFVISVGTPSIIVLVKGSKAEKHFLTNYS